MKRTAILIIAAALFSGLSFAGMTGVVQQVVLKKITEPELLDITPEPGTLMWIIGGAPRDVRIFDGVNPEGIPLYAFDALTNLQGKASGEIDMDGHTLRLNNLYTVQAAGNILSIYDATGTNPVFQVVGREAGPRNKFSLPSPQVQSVSEEGIVALVNHLEGYPNIVVEATTSLVAPNWQPIDVEQERHSPTSVQIHLPPPEEDGALFFRVSTTSMDVCAKLYVPLWIEGSMAVTNVVINEPHSVAKTNGEIQITVGPPRRRPRSGIFTRRMYIRSPTRFPRTPKPTRSISLFQTSPTQLGILFFPRVGYLMGERR